MTLDEGLIVQIAAAEQVPTAWLRAQILVESSGDPFAFRYEDGFFDRYIRDSSAAKAARFGPLAACSYGLLQIMLETAYEIGFTGRPEDLFVPRIGLTWGARKMRGLWLWAGGLDSDYDQALAAYNGGTVHNATVPFRNQAYVDRVHAQRIG